MIHDEGSLPELIWQYVWCTRRHLLAPRLAKHLGLRFVVISFERRCVGARMRKTSAADCQCILDKSCSVSDVGILASRECVM